MLRNMLLIIRLLASETMKFCKSRVLRCSGASTNCARFPVVPTFVKVPVGLSDLSISKMVFSHGVSAVQSRYTDLSEGDAVRNTEDAGGESSKTTIPPPV